MNRHALAPAAVAVFSLVCATSAFAQGAQSAKPTSSAPASPARFVKPVKGMAYVQMIQGKSKVVGKDVVTVLTVKNLSGGAIHLLKIDEYWYDKTRKKIVTASTEAVRKPINPGDVVEVTMKTPRDPEMDTSQYMFSHANGKVDVKVVKKFE